MPNKFFVSTSYISKSKIVALFNIIFQPLYNCTYFVPSALQAARFFVPPVFWSPQKCHWSLTLVAAVSDFKEGGVDDAGSQRADRQCTYSSRRGRRAREWRDKGAPSAQVHYWQPLCTTSKYPGNIKNIKILRFYSRGCRIFIFRVVN